MVWKQITWWLLLKSILRFSRPAVGSRTLYFWDSVAPSWHLYCCPRPSFRVTSVAGRPQVPSIALPRPWLLRTSWKRNKLLKMAHISKLTHQSASFRVSFKFPVCVYHFTFLKILQVPDEYCDHLRDKKPPHSHVLSLIVTNTKQ